jgi:hypothetical protein
VATTTGYRIYNVVAPHWRKVYQRRDAGAQELVQMLYSTSLVACVGAGAEAALSPRTVRLFNTRTERFICELNFLNTVSCWTTKNVVLFRVGSVATPNPPPPVAALLPGEKKTQQQHSVITSHDPFHMMCLL